MVSSGPGYAWDVPRTSPPTNPARARGCASHPGAPVVGRCDRCGRPLCLRCAVPVRGQVLDLACVSAVAGEPDPAGASRAPARVRSADPLATVGFGLVLLLSVLPWSRFGSRSGLFEAWLTPWPLLAVLAAAVGLAFSVVSWRRWVDLRVQVAVHGGLAVVVWVGVLLFHLGPRDPLSAVTEAPAAALLAASLVLLSTARRTTVLLRARRSV